MLLDVRSCIAVSFVVSTKELSAVGDINFSETMYKARLEATAKALGNVAGGVMSYLKSVPVLD